MKLRYLLLILALHVSHLSLHVTHLVIQSRNLLFLRQNLGLILLVMNLHGLHFFEIKVILLLQDIQLSCNFIILIL